VLSFLTVRMRIPRLEDLKERWVVPPVLAGKVPTRYLARSLARAFSACGWEHSSAELEGHLGAGVQRRSSSWPASWRKGDESPYD
jgi:hypothetical protein